MRGLLLVVFCLLASNADAEFFLGFKLGTVRVDVSTEVNPRNLAVDLGYRLDTGIADLSLAAEASRSVTDGETSKGADLEFQSEAVYLFGKTTRSSFLSYRVGYVRDKIIRGNRTRRNDGWLLGAGIGVVIGKTLLHLEYTEIAGDAQFFSIGLDF